MFIQGMNCIECTLLYKLMTFYIKDVDLNPTQEAFVGDGNPTTSPNIVM